MKILSNLTEDQKIHYNAWNEHLNNTRERTNYSIRRMDLLIISICGAGIYIIFETLREFKTGKIDINEDYVLATSGVLLLLAITINFISQVTGYFANDFEEKYIIEELKSIEGKEFDLPKQKEYDKNTISYNSWTKICNILSVILMFLGLGFLAYFNYKLL